MVQRGHNFAIVDEVDSILIDEARTPLIISGPTEDRSEFYKTIDALIKELIKDKTNFEHDEKQRQVLLTEEGSERIEEILEQEGHLAEDSAGLYDPANISIIHPENQTLASVTIQNYFRMYSKLSGMTGTAATEAQEFIDIYKMDVAEIPTNRPVIRIDDDDEVYRTAAEKNRAVTLLIEDCYRRGQPILVGTVTIEKSEQLSEILKAHTFELDGKTIRGIPHNVLNARFHEQEAAIVADAGVPGAVTIATNMAGRGTDIQLGGNVDMKVMKWREEQLAAGIEVTPEQALAHRAEIEADIADLKKQALEAGGLFVLGTERHESR